MIMRDVNNGWAVRYTHANVASFFFIFVYAQWFNTYFNHKKFLNFLILNHYLYLFNKIIYNFLNMIEPKTINTTTIQAEEKDNEFLQWFVGFSDAESAFMINIKNNREVHFVFQITLHIEDAAVLYKIRDRLGIGIVSVKGNTCSFRVNSFQVIINSLLPIFDKYPLLTHKQLNYRDWRKAILLKKLLKENSRSLSTSIFNEILELKNSMNNLRTDYEGYIISSEMINKHWLVGFIEAGRWYFLF